MRPMVIKRDDDMDGWIRSNGSLVSDIVSPDGVGYLPELFLEGAN